MSNEHGQDVLIECTACAAVMLYWQQPNHNCK